MLTVASPVRPARGGLDRAALLACALATALSVVLFMSTPKPNHDVWHQMALAREALALGYVPTTDLYSYAPTITPVVRHEWLAGMVALAAYRAGGMNGFMLLWFGITAALWTACFIALRDARLAVRIGAVALMGPLVMYSQFQPCVAQSYSSLFTAITLLIVRRDAAASHFRWLLVCFPVAVIWANLHAGAVIGVVILAAYGLERALTRRPWRAGIAMAAAAAGAFAVSPFGFSYYPYLARAIPMSRPEIPQWQPLAILNLGSLHSWLFIASLLLLLLAIRRRGLFLGSVITLVLAVTVLRAGKNLPFYAISWLIFVARQMEIPAISRRVVLSAGLLSTAAIVPLAALIWGTAPWHVVLPSDLKTTQGPLALPVHAADYLERTGFHGNVMTFFRHGAYLSWRLYPKVKVSCDARYEEVYPLPDVDRNFEAYLRRPELFRDEVARLPQTHLILIDRRMAANRALQFLPGWHAVYNDEIFTLLARR